MPQKFERHDDAEEALIQAGIDADPDNPELTAEDFARARPAWEMMPGLVPRPGQETSRTTTLVSVALDQDLLDRLRATGRNWQARMNDVLRKAIMDDGPA